MPSTSPEKPLILLVEDEPIQATILEQALKEAGFKTRRLESGGEVVPWVREHQPDGVLLDLVLPDADGFEVCRRIREFSTVPLIMTTGRVEEADRLRGLDLGADDYVCKPLSPPEVVARLRALFRRQEQWHSPPALPGLDLEEEALRASWNGQLIDLTAVEFRLLATLAKQPERVFSRDRLLDVIHSDDRAVSDRAVDSHIKNLRRKLAAAGIEPDPIQSVYGEGYRFRLDG